MVYKWKLYTLLLPATKNTIRKQSSPIKQPNVRSAHLKRHSINDIHTANSDAVDWMRNYNNL